MALPPSEYELSSPEPSSPQGVQVANYLGLPARAGAKLAPGWSKTALDQLTRIKNHIINKGYPESERLVYSAQDVPGQPLFMGDSFSVRPTYYQIPPNQSYRLYRPWDARTLPSYTKEIGDPAYFRAASKPSGNLSTAHSHPDRAPFSNQDFRSYLSFPGKQGSEHSVLQGFWPGDDLLWASGFRINHPNAFLPMKYGVRSNEGTVFTNLLDEFEQVAGLLKEPALVPPNRRAMLEQTLKETGDYFPIGRNFALRKFGVDDAIDYTVQAPRRHLETFDALYPLYDDILESYMRVLDVPSPEIWTHFKTLR